MIKKITPQDIDWINENIKSDMNTLWVLGFQKINHEIGFWNPWYTYWDLDTILNEWKIVWFVLWESDSYRRYWEITKLYIYEWWRGKWRGKELLSKIEEHFLCIGMSSCELVTFTQEWKNFYTKSWYELLAQYEKKYHENDPLKKRFLLTRKLNNPLQ